MMPGKRIPKSEPIEKVRENLTPAEEQLRRDTEWELDLIEAGDALYGDRAKPAMPSGKKAKA